MTPTFLMLLAWVPVTLFLHILIHEGAHWLALRAVGIPARIYPYPHRRNGRWYWGYAEPEEALDWSEAWRIEKGLVLFAPVLAELLWAVLVLSVALVWPPAALEAVAAFIDILNWLRTWNKPGSDAARLLELLR